MGGCRTTESLSPSSSPGLISHRVNRHGSGTPVTRAAASVWSCVSRDMDLKEWPGNAGRDAWGTPRPLVPMLQRPAGLVLAVSSRAGAGSSCIPSCPLDVPMNQGPAVGELCHAGPSFHIRSTVSSSPQGPKSIQPEPCLGQWRSPRCHRLSHPPGFLKSRPFWPLTTSFRNRCQHAGCCLLEGKLWPEHSTVLGL